MIPVLCCRIWTAVTMSSSNYRPACWMSMVNSTVCRSLRSLLDFPWFHPFLVFVDTLELYVRCSFCTMQLQDCTYLMQEWKWRCFSITVFALLCRETVLDLAARDVSRCCLDYRPEKVSFSLTDCTSCNHVRWSSLPAIMQRTMSTLFVMCQTLSQLPRITDSAQLVGMIEDIPA